MRHPTRLHRKPAANYRRGARLLCIAAILGSLTISLACTRPSGDWTVRGSRGSVNSGQPLDENGVAKFLSAAPGVQFHLGKDNPNVSGNFQIERKTPALRRTDGAVEYWNVTAHDLDYASGASGKTSTAAYLHRRWASKPTRGRPRRVFLPLLPISAIKSSLPSSASTASSTRSAQRSP